MTLVRDVKFVRTTMGDLFVSAEDVARFHEDGAIHMRAAFGTDWVEKIRQGIQVTVCTYNEGPLLLVPNILGSIPAMLY